MDSYDSIQRQNSLNDVEAQPFPAPGRRVVSAPNYQLERPRSEAPTFLKSWYSQQSFRQITSFIIMISVLVIASVGWFNQILSSDQQLGVCSSILMLSAPSPFSTKKTKYIGIQPPQENI